METRIKQSKELIWVTGGIFFGMVILSIFVHGVWELAVFFGILLVVGLILYYLDKDNDLVIDDRGIHQVKGVITSGIKSIIAILQADWKAAMAVIAVHPGLLI
jgi:hypothetical protein